jgi:carotenoid cleavage dioxygenase-like enzyme
MSLPFPQHPFLSGNFAPISIEGDAHDLPVVGAIPPELDGTLYRIGPNPQFAPRDRNHHWFLGDGMVHAFTIQGGKASYRNRWVRTPRFALEREAGRALFGSWGNPMTTDPSAQGCDSGVANTNIIAHAGRLLALEEGHRPFELASDSLDPHGYLDLNTQLDRFTAHPKVDAETGELMFFSYGSGAPLSATMSYGVINRKGCLARLDRFEAPFSSMVHDFMTTANHVLFPVLPLTGDLGRAMKGGPAFAWEPEKGAYLGVLKRDRPVSEIRWLEVEPCYVFHPMNAWEADGKIFADVMRYDTAPLFPRPDGSIDRNARPEAKLCRWTVDLAAGKVRHSDLDDTAGEFPRIDDRRNGLAYRHGWFAAQAIGFSFGAIVHVDHATGARQRYELPAGDAASEPVFVPRAADAEEGDGWLLLTVYRAAEHRSDLMVLDARDVTRGPVATVQLSQRVPFGFHGNWRAQAA